MTNETNCVELGRLAVPGMRIKVRWFPAGANNRQVWHAPSSILSFSRVIGDTVQHRDMAKSSTSFHPAGPLTFWPPSAVWESRKNHSQVLTVSAYFDTDFTSATVNRNPQGIRIDDFSMLEMMQILHDEVRTPGVAAYELVGAIGAILRIKLSRLMSQQARNPTIRKPCRSVDGAMINAMLRHTGGRLPTTAELAGKFNLGRRDLLRLCKETTGKPPSRYIEETKLDRAKTLLATSTLTMKQIAYEAGYSTASHFSTRFGQLTGLTPSAFRSRARRRNDLDSREPRLEQGPAGFDVLAHRGVAADASPSDSARRISSCSLAASLPRPATALMRSKGISRPQNLHEMQRLRHVRQAVQAAMEAVVDAPRRGPVTGVESLLEFIGKRAQLGDVLRRDVFRRATDEPRLEHQTQFQNLFRGRCVEWDDAGPPVGIAVDIAFGLQELQRLAHGCDAQLQALRDFGLLEPRATREHPGNDSLAQEVSDLFLLRPEVDALRCAFLRQPILPHSNTTSFEVVI